MPRFEDFLEEEDRAESVLALLHQYRDKWEPELPPPGPIVMFGTTGGAHIGEYTAPLGWGAMWSAGEAYPTAGQPWGFDNGAWVSFARGDGTFPEETFLERLEQAHEHSVEIETPPAVAVAPDLVSDDGGGMDSLEFSVKWVTSGRLPDDWPWYLALQVGMTVEAVEEVLHHFDGLFLGGAREMKDSARIWTDLAREYEVPFHYGQCGTVPKLAHAFEIGVTTLDSAAPVKTRRGLARFMRYYDTLIEKYPNYQGTEAG